MKQMTPYESRLRAWAKNAGMQNFLTAKLNEVEEFMLNCGDMSKFHEAFPEYKKMRFEKVDYRILNARQKETHNFHVVSGILATYGFDCIRISSDWEGADFLAWHMTADRLLKVQLKSAMGIYKKYEDKDIWMTFPVRRVGGQIDTADWYLIEHYRLKEIARFHTNALRTAAWNRPDGHFTWPRPSKAVREALIPYRIL